MGKIARGSWEKKMFEKMSSPRGLYSSETLEEAAVLKDLDYDVTKPMRSLNNRSNGQ